MRQKDLASSTFFCLTSFCPYSFFLVTGTKPGKCQASTGPVFCARHDPHPFVSAGHAENAIIERVFHQRTSRRGCNATAGDLTWLGSVWYYAQLAITLTVGLGGRAARFSSAAGLDRHGLERTGLERPAALAACPQHWLYLPGCQQESRFMTLDASAYCPGGSGKKIKHCACRDISGELEKIMRALEGNQRVAALDRINRVLATKANRPCLLSLKILTLMDMKDMQSLEETVTTFVQVAPDNALAHTFAALLEVRKNHPKAAVNSLQAAIRRATESFPGELYDAIGAVAQVLASDNQYMAARGHLLFRAMIGGQEQDAIEPLLSISSAGSVPTLLKRDLIFAGSPEGVAWRDRFDAAAQECARGAWSAALETLEQLDKEYPGQAEILRNIATARSYLGYAGCAEAWHTYATLESLDFNEAVKAEATYQLLDFEAFRKSVGLVKITMNVTDASALQEKLLSAKQLVNSPVNPAEQRQDDSPPPKARFQLIDRPAAVGDQELTLDNVPRMVGSLLLFGKETDREARYRVGVGEG